MANAYNHDDYPTPIDTINNSIVPNPNAKVVRLTVQFLNAGREGILAEFSNFGADAPLDSPVEHTEFPQGRGRELKAVAHRHRAPTSPILS